MIIYLLLILVLYICDYSYFNPLAVNLQLARFLKSSFCTNTKLLPEVLFCLKWALQVTSLLYGNHSYSHWNLILICIDCVSVTATCKVPLFAKKQTLLIFVNFWRSAKVETSEIELGQVRAIFLAFWHMSNLKRQSSCRTSCAYLTQNFTTSLMVSIFFVKN